MNYLENLENQFASVANVKNQLFDVVKLPLTPNLEGFNAPNSFGMYKLNGGNCLGTVGKDFTPTPSKVLFESFEECLYDNVNIDINNLEYKEMKGGAKIMFKVPVGKIAFKNLRGEDDTSILNLHLQTGYDGLTKTSLYLSMYRLVCANGMKAYRTEFQVSFKNTSNNIGKIASMCNDVNKAIAQGKNLEELILRCNSVQINESIKQDFLKKVLGYNEIMRGEISKKAANILDAVLDSMELEFSRTGANVWGLVNGITHYTNHKQNVKDSNTHLFVDGGLKLNDKAQKVILEYV